MTLTHITPSLGRRPPPFSHPGKYNGPDLKSRCGCDLGVAYCDSVLVETLNAFLEELSDDLSTLIGLEFLSQEQRVATFTVLRTRVCPSTQENTVNNNNNKMFTRSTAARGDTNSSCSEVLIIYHFTVRMYTYCTLYDKKTKLVRDGGITC